MSESNTAENLETQNTAETVAPAKAKGKVGRPKNHPSTKLAQCKALFLTLNSEGKNRDEVIEAFQAAFNPPITKGTAQVYYHEAKNAAIAQGVTIVPKQTKASKKAAAPVEAPSDASVTAETAPVAVETQSTEATVEVAG